MNHEKYASYSVEDYLEDEDFRHWIFEPDDEANERWQAVFSHFPAQNKVAAQARVLLLEMKDYFQPAALQAQAPDPAFISSLRKNVSAEQEGKVVRMQRRGFIRRIAVSASVLLMMGVGAMLWLENARFQTITTQYGEWKTDTLPDGSVIRLNANSELTFAHNWKAGEDRKVWLKGEAFFEVVHDAQGSKFTVVTDDLAVQVLGTAFNVHSRGQQTEVFLEEGKIRLDMGKDEQLLEPGEFIAYSAQKKAITEFKKAPAELHTSWKDGSLILKDKTAAEILEKIEEIYGYTLNLENRELPRDPKTIAIPMDKIELAIPILERVLGLKIRLENDQLMVK